MVALIVGVVTIGPTLRLRRQTPPDPAPVVRSHAFWVVVAVEVVAIAVGIPALTLSGHGKYVAPWVAAVVGLHFLAFGRLIGRFWYPVGAVLLAGAAAGAAVGATGAGVGAVEAISGLIASATLLTASGYRAIAPPVAALV